MIQSKETGFSLVELLVVLALISILSVVGYNNFISSKPSAVKGTLNILQGHLAQARSLARSTGQTIGIRTSGSTQADLQMEYAVAVMVSGSVTGIGDSTQQGGKFTHAGLDSTAKRYSLVDINKVEYDLAAPNPALPSSILTALLTPTVPATTFPTPLFKGGTGNDFSIFFDTVGRPNMDFYVAVTSGSSGTVDGSGPMGIVIVTRNNGISSFYKAIANNVNEKWKRL